MQDTHTHTYTELLINGGKVLARKVVKSVQSNYSKLKISK